MSDGTQQVLIVGAGPASLYAAERLAKEGKEVTIVNRDIKPGGLAEFGIYPNKYKMKNGLRRYFARILDREEVTYLGNVTVGEEGNVSLEELQELGFDATVVAVGAQGTKWLGLPGEEAEAVYHAKDLVYHYNGLPPFSERDFEIGENVCVVGLGNVCLDIIHWLVIDRKVASATAIARRGPAERAYTEKEMKIVSGALDVEQIEREFAEIADELQSVGQNPGELHQEVVAHIDQPLEEESPTRFRIRFLRSPARIEVDDAGRVTGLVCEKTRLVDRPGRMGVERLGEFETIPCDTVVFAIGDSIEPAIGLPLEPKWESSFATVPEPWEENPDRDRYMVWNPQTGSPMWGTFVVGWARKASDGLVGKARADAVQGCDEILHYLDGGFDNAPSQADGRNPDARDDLRNLLAERGVEAVEWEEVQRLYEYEDEVAKAEGVEEFKVSNRADMLRICKEDAGVER